MIPLGAASVAFSLCIQHHGQYFLIYPNANYILSWDSLGWHQVSLSPAGLCVPRLFPNSRHLIRLQIESFFIALCLFATGNLQNAKYPGGAFSSDPIPGLTHSVRLNKAGLCVPYPKSKGQGSGGCKYSVCTDWVF